MLALITAATDYMQALEHLLSVVHSNYQESVAGRITPADALANCAALTRESLMQDPGGSKFTLYSETNHFRINKSRNDRVARKQATKREVARTGVHLDYRDPTQTVEPPSRISHPLSFRPGEYTKPIPPSPPPFDPSAATPGMSAAEALSMYEVILESELSKGKSRDEAHALAHHAYPDGYAEKLRREATTKEQADKLAGEPGDYTTPEEYKPL